MSTRHLVDPQLLPVLDEYPRRTLSSETLSEVRSFIEQRAPQSLSRELTDAVSMRELRIPGSVGSPEVRVLVYVPFEKKAMLPAYLHIHGGGYVAGSADVIAAADMALARDIGCVVVSVDYRLAPETRFPGAVEDCYAALKWLHAQADNLDVDRGRIAIGGASAGGGLAAALAILARDRREVPVAFQLLMCPMLDDRTSYAELSPLVGEFLWTRESNIFGWTSLLGHPPGKSDVSPYAAAARVSDVTGLPQAFISVGALDLFLEEDIHYAMRLLGAGIPAELHVYPGAFHGFESFGNADVSKSALRNAHEALRRAFGSIA